jgi:hypothetical protein
MFGSNQRCLLRLIEDVMQTYQSAPEVYGAEHRRISLTLRDCTALEEAGPSGPARFCCDTYCLLACAAALALAFAAS